MALETTRRSRRSSIERSGSPTALNGSVSASCLRAGTEAAGLGSQPTPFRSHSPSGRSTLSAEGQSNVPCLWCGPRRANRCWSGDQGSDGSARRRASCVPIHPRQVRAGTGRRRLVAGIQACSSRMDRPLPIREEGLGRAGAPCMDDPGRRARRRSVKRASSKCQRTNGLTACTLKTSWGQKRRRSILQPAAPSAGRSRC